MGRFFRRVGRAFREAWKAYARRFSRTMGFLALELCLCLLCLAPLMLVTEGGLLRYFAALAAVLWILGMLPARINAARAMQDGLEGGSLFTPVLGDFTAYGKKLLHGLRQGAYLLLWAAPLIAVVVYVYLHFAGAVDALTAMRMLRDFGGGKVTNGAIYLALLLAGLLLLLYLGAGFHSGARHAFALGEKHVLRRRRFGNLVCWIIAQAVILLPVWAALVIALSRYVSLLDNINGLFYGSVSLPSTKTTLLILGIGAAVSLPFMPLRSLVTAAYVRELNKEREEKE